MSRQDALIGWGMKYYHEIITADPVLFAAKADTNAGDRELLRKLKEGLTFGHKGWAFVSWEFIKPSETPIVPISRWSSKKVTPKSKLNAYLTLTTGVYKFTFKNEAGEKIDALYMLYEFGSKQDLLSLVLLPSGHLNLWARFESKLVAMKAPRVKPSTKMAYVIGSCSQTPSHRSTSSRM